MALFSCEYAVLLDCEVFDAVRFDFDNRNVVHVAELARSGQIKVVVTSVIVEEIKNHVAKEARRVADQLRTAGTNALVRGYDADLTAKLSHATLATEIARAGQVRLQRFLKHAKAEIIPVDSVAVTPIFADYFASLPPFGTGKKKSEFPDAFTLHALRTWAKDKKYPAVVVSNDGDLKTFCEANPPLRSMPTLSAFLAILPDAEIAGAVMQWMEDQWDAVQEFVGNELPEFSYNLEGVDGTVDGARLLSMQVLDRSSQKRKYVVPKPF